MAFVDRLRGVREPAEQLGAAAAYER